MGPLTANACLKVPSGVAHFDILLAHAVAKNVSGLITGQNGLTVSSGMTRLEDVSDKDLIVTTLNASGLITGSKWTDVCSLCLSPYHTAHRYVGRT